MRTKPELNDVRWLSLKKRVCILCQTYCYWKSITKENVLLWVFQLFGPNIWTWIYVEVVEPLAKQCITFKNFFSRCFPMYLTYANFITKKEIMHCTAWCLMVHWALSAWSRSGLHFSPALRPWAKHCHHLCLSYLICQMGLFRVSVL